MKGSATVLTATEANHHRRTGTTVTIRLKNGDREAASIEPPTAERHFRRLPKACRAAISAASALISIGRTPKSSTWFSSPKNWAWERLPRHRPPVAQQCLWEFRG